MNNKIFDISVIASERNKQLIKEDLAKGNPNIAKCRCCNKNPDFYFIINPTTRFWLCSDCTVDLFLNIKKEGVK